MRRSVWSLSCAVALLVVLAGCCAEHREVKDDVSRAWQHQMEHLDVIQGQIARYGRVQLGMVQPTSTDLERFLVWRKHEWWALERDFALLVYEEWANISKLTGEVARYYGYNVSKWPQMTESVVRFYALADDEWRNLLLDVSVFIEYNMAKRHALGADMQRWYDQLDWEYANMRVDVANFLEWREREYAKLAGQHKAYWRSNLELIEDFKQDVGRFGHDHLKAKPKLIALDLERWVESNLDDLPKLGDDMYRYWQANTTDIKLADDMRRSMRMAKHEGVRLTAAVKRYGANQAEEARQLLAAFDRWRYTYEREFGPLKDDVARYWRYHLSMGEVTMADVRRFFDLGEEEYYKMKADVARFVGYSAEEWEGLKGNFHRFFTCGRQGAFGSGTTPFPGDNYGQIKDNNPVWRSRWGNAQY